MSTKIEKQVRINLERQESIISNGELNSHRRRRRVIELPPVKNSGDNLPKMKSANYKNNYTEFSLDLGLNYTCHRIISSGGDHNRVTNNYCGECNSCEILARISRLKQWFDRASHSTQKRLLVGLLARIKSPNAHDYLVDVLKPLSNYSKDFIYSRNKYLPSVDQDTSKVTNDRCLSDSYINKETETLWSWYTNPSTTDYVKINFFLSVLQRCDQSVVLYTVQRLKESPLSRDPSHLEISKTIRFSVGGGAVAGDDTESEIIYEMTSSDDEESPARKEAAINRDQHGNTYVDFIRYLPVHLSKKILNSLSKKQLYNCLFVCKYWCNLIKEVHKEGFLHKILIDDMMLLKGTSSKGTNPRYANNVDVRVPNLVAGTNEVIRNPDEPEATVTFKSECNWSNALAGFSTRNVIMEERNVLCGQYNVLVLKDRHDEKRVCHLNGPTTVAYTHSLDQKVRFIDVKTGVERPPTIQGHAGSVKSMYMYEKKRLLITGSYDTSIRMWSIDNGRCARIFQGHQQTVTCLAMYEPHERLISGSADKTCKVWLLGRKKCWRTFKHRYPIVSVAIGEELCASGGLTGRIKVFDMINGTLIKKIVAHQGPVNQVKFDRWHLVSCGSDSYALVFSTQGKHKKCLIALRHPKPVLCLEYAYLRAITGSADGKLRIWNILNGECLRVVRGNSQCDAIRSMSLTSDLRRLLINTENNILLMEFERVEYEYGSSPYMNSGSNELRMGEEYDEDEMGGRSPRKKSKKRSKQSLSGKTYPSIRASRSELVCTPNVKLFDKNATAQQPQQQQHVMNSRSLALEHSARPISARDLKNAELVHRVTTSARTLMVSKSSTGNISEFALLKRQTIVNSINAAIMAKKSDVALVARLPNDKSSIKTSLSENQNATGGGLNEISLDIFTSSMSSSQFNPDEASAASTRPATLNETKQALRGQLKHIKQHEQLSSDVRKRAMINEAKKVAEDNADAKSCVLEREIHSSKKRPKSGAGGKLNEERPRSSPSRIDTKTKVRIGLGDAERIRQMNEERKQSVANVNVNVTKPPQTAPPVVSSMSQQRNNSSISKAKSLTNIQNMKDDEKYKKKEAAYEVQVRSRPATATVALSRRPKHRLKALPSTAPHLNTPQTQSSGQIPALMRATSMIRVPTAATTTASWKPTTASSAHRVRPITGLMTRSQNTNDHNVMVRATATTTTNQLPNDELNLMTFKQVEKLISRMSDNRGGFCLLENRSNRNNLHPIQQQFLQRQKTSIAPEIINE